MVVLSNTPVSATTLTTTDKYIDCERGTLRGVSCLMPSEKTSAAWCNITLQTGSGNMLLARGRLGDYVGLTNNKLSLKLNGSERIKFRFRTHTTMTDIQLYAWVDTDV